MYGALVRNTSGQLLMSSEVEALHCGGKAAFQGTILSGLSNFPTYAADDTIQTLSGRFVHRYAFNSTTAPLFFIKPIVTTDFHGILQQFNSGNTWFVDIIQTGYVSRPPVIYAFVTPSNVPATGSSVGMATYLPDGRPAFDSRLMPLAIAGAYSVVPPTIPCDGGTPQTTEGHPWNDSTLDFNFKSNNTYNAYSSVGRPPSDLMFSAPSTAQAVYSRLKRGFKNSRGSYSSQDHWSSALWWVMYHSAYRMIYGQVHAGWAPYAADFSFSSAWEGTGWYEFSGGGGEIQVGNRPYNNKTINLAPNILILAVASHYD